MPDDARPATRRRYVRAVGPRLKRLLALVFGMFALLTVNGVYLGAVTAAEAATGATYQNYFYQLMFLGHLLLGFVMLPIVVVFGVAHIKAAHDRPNRTAVNVGYALFAATLVLLLSGVVLTRIEGLEAVTARDPQARSVAYWIHVVAPVVVGWLFVLHRLSGPKLHWSVGLRWAAVAGVFALGMLGLHSQDPKAWNVEGPASGEQYFFPSLSRTATGDFIPADTLVMDDYCLECHADVHARWANSVHRFGSFNNPAYLFSVRETRQVAFERDGDVQAARFCAGCHDPVPFFSGAFDDPDFDDVNHPTAAAGITCTVCHAITHINSPRGNADYTIEAPSHYPFARSENPLLAWTNRQLVKAKPAFHKKTFLKPLHKTEDFCGACHKVHLPPELNGYKWLRGQDHLDTYRLSGVSGHGVTSFYYPQQAEPNCNGCHMPLQASDDFGARDFDGSGALSVHDHLFPSANTAIPHLLDLPPEVIEAHRAFNDGVMRVDLFGIKEGGTIEGALHAPLGPVLPELQPGGRYLLETVIRTLKMGHVFTQGTSDSNEIWLDLVIRDGDRVIGRSGGRAPEGDVDPWSHFVNSYVVDREGHRIDRRNAQDIFVPLYSHQIPPGAGDVVHYAFEVPDDATGPLTVEAALRYRKFDTLYMRYFQGESFDGNDLPIMTLATDRVMLPVAGGAPLPADERSSSATSAAGPTGGAADGAPAGAAHPAANKAAPGFPLWQRWNDYGIGLLRKGDEGSSRGELRGAEAAFLQVEALGRADGPLNRARVYVKEGRVDEAAAALTAATHHDPPAPPWSVLWFGGLVQSQNGYLDEAIDSFTALIEMDTEETRARGFDFSQDWRVLNELGRTLFERSRQERGEAGRPERERLLREAEGYYGRALEFDPESAEAHYGLAQVYTDLGDEDRAAEQREHHARYKPDDNARDRAIVAARRADPAADHAAEAIVIYDLQRPGAFELPADAAREEGR